MGLLLGLARVHKIECLVLLVLKTRIAGASDVASRAARSRFVRDWGSKPPSPPAASSTALFRGVVDRSVVGGGGDGVIQSTSP